MPKRIPVQNCAAVGCARLGNERGMCHMHYKRWRRWGHPDVRYGFFSLEDRFWSQVVTDGECWIWLGSTNRGGYGLMPQGSVENTTHRWVWSQYRGDPGDLHVLHTCDVRNCVRLEHLWLGTNADNVADKTAKGRATGRTSHEKAGIA